MSIRTDLASEMRGFLGENEIDGVSHTEETTATGIKISRTEIENETGSKIMEKPPGKYVCIEAGNLQSAVQEDFEILEQVFCNELKGFLPVKDDIAILCVGLGNRGITADALGSKTIDKLLITRHLKGVIPDELTSVLNSVCAITPSVIGVTGLETAQTVKSIAREIKPDAVIVIDALASRSIEKIGNTIQITDTGISPGSGVGNTGEAITENELGCKVIAVGVPMVVYSSTIIHDVLEKITDTDKADEIYLRTVIERKNMDTVVTPKEIDDITEGVSTILAKGINMCLHPKADRELIEKLMF